MEGRGGAWKWVGRSFGFASTPNAGLLRAGHADASENLILQPPTLDPDTFLPRSCGKACPSFGVPGPLFSARPQGLYLAALTPEGEPGVCMSILPAHEAPGMGADYAPPPPF